MAITLTMKYIDGKFVPIETFLKFSEGKEFMATLEAIENTDEHFDEDLRLIKLFQSIDNYGYQLPPDYKFNRDELYDRKCFS